MARRYEREIEDILRQAGEVGPGPVRRRRGFLGSLRAYAASALGGKTWAITPGRVMLAAGALLLVGLLMPAFVQGSVWAPLAWGGLILFIVGYAMFFIRPRKADKRWRGRPIDDSPDKRWRGQPIDDGDDNLWERLTRRNR